MIAPSFHKDGYVCSLRWVPFESPSMADDRPNRVRTVDEAACRAHGAPASMSSGAGGSTASGAAAGPPIRCRDLPAGSDWSIFPSTWVHVSRNRAPELLSASRGLGDLGDLSVPSRKKRGYVKRIEWNETVP